MYTAGGAAGTATNAAGFYSLTVPAQDSVRLTAGYLGYGRATVTLAGRRTVPTLLCPGARNELAEVQVRGTADAPLERRVEMSTLQIPMAQLRQLPALLGEPDVLRAFQLMPGVQAGREGSGALYVRGGSPDQNLTLLDDVPIYYVSHVGGFCRCSMQRHQRRAPYQGGLSGPLRGPAFVGAGCAPERGQQGKAERQRGYWCTGNPFLPRRAAEK